MERNGDLCIPGQSIFKAGIDFILEIVCVCKYVLTLHLVVKWLRSRRQGWSLTIKYHKQIYSHNSQRDLGEIHAHRLTFLIYLVQGDIQICEIILINPQGRLLPPPTSFRGCSRLNFKASEDTDII